MKPQIYLDYAAATPLDKRVLEAMQPYFTDKFYNPSASYLAARAVKNDLDKARHRVAAGLGAKLAEIIFTAGATEANNLAIQGIMRRYPDAEVLVSAIEHESVLAPAKLFNYLEIPVDNQGLIILNKLSNLISDKTVLISLMLVNNELGTIQPLREVSMMIEKIRQSRLAKNHKLPLYLHTDAAQAANYLDLHVNRLGVDLMGLNGGKIYGPKQSGLLYLKAGLELQPLIVGGGQEFGWRSGTENVAGSLGFSKALEIAQQIRAEESQRILGLRQFFETELQKLVPQAHINGAKNRRTPHIISVMLPGTDNERAMMELDERGIRCAVGSACSASREEASHVLSAIGLSQDQARSTLRFSLGRQTTKKAIQTTIKELSRLTDYNR